MVVLVPVPTHVLYGTQQNILNKNLFSPITNKHLNGSDLRIVLCVCVTKYEYLDDCIGSIYTSTLLKCPLLRFPAHPPEELIWNAWQQSKWSSLQPPSPARPTTHTHTQLALTTPGIETLFPPPFYNILFIWFWVLV